MNFNLQKISTEFITKELMPSLLSDQLFNLTVLGTFLLSRRRVLLKTYSHNKISTFAKLLLRYQSRSQIKSSVEYLQKMGKYMFISVFVCSLIRVMEKGSNVKSQMRIEELLKPVLLFKIYQLNLGVGLGLGLVNLGSKYLLSQELKEFM